MANFSEMGLALDPSQVRSFAMDADTSVDDLSSLGIGVAQDAFETMTNYYGVAEDESPINTTPSVTNAIQFFQYFMPKGVEIVTAARVADDLLGRTFAGTWTDEEVVIPVNEMIGQPKPYGDTANIPFASFNHNFEVRNIVRMELGLQIQKLEAKRASKMRIDANAMKRNSVATALAISANDIAFNGFNNGRGHTYGILNDPSLPAATTVATGASGATEWVSKTFAEIVADIRAAMQKLRTQTMGNFDPKRDACTIGIALDAMESLNYTTDFGMSVQEFMQKNYPKARIVAVPQFNNAVMGDNVFFVIADKINGSKCVEQIVQQELFLVGAMQQVKGFEEDYSNATAGTLVSQPIGVVEYAGI